MLEKIIGGLALCFTSSALAQELPIVNFEVSSTKPNGVYITDNEEDITLRLSIDAGDHNKDLLYDADDGWADVHIVVDLQKPYSSNEAVPGLTSSVAGADFVWPYLEEHNGAVFTLVGPEYTTDFTIDIIDDDEHEEAEDFTMKFSDAHLGLEDTRPVEPSISVIQDVTIDKNDQPPLPVVNLVIGLESINYSYKEDLPKHETVVGVKIFSGGDDLPSELTAIGFQLKTTPITADDQYESDPKDPLGRYDYEAPHPEGLMLFIAMNLAGGHTRAEWQVEFVNDDVTENIERFRVALFEPSFIPSGVVHEDSTITFEDREGQVTILDDDMSRTYLRDRDQYVTEGIVDPVEIFQVLDQGHVAYNFTNIHLTISGPFLGSGLNLPWAAVLGSDFVGYSQTIEHFAFSTGKATFLTIKDDDIPERYKPLNGHRKDEAMKVELLRNGLDLDDVELSNPSSFIHIWDDDPAFYVDEAAITQTNTHWRIPISLAYPVPRAVSVEYEFEHSDGGHGIAGRADFAPDTSVAWASFEKDGHVRDTIKLFNASHGKILDPDKLTGEHDRPDDDFVDEAVYMAHLSESLSTCFPSGRRNSSLDSCPTPTGGYGHIETYGIERIANPPNTGTRWTETYQVEVVDNNLYRNYESTSVEVRWCFEDENGVHTRTTHCTARGRLDTDCGVMGGDPMLLDSVSVRNVDHCSLSTITAQPWVRMGEGSPSWMQGSPTCYPDPCPGENRRDRSDPPVLTPLPTNPPPVEQVTEPEPEPVVETESESSLHYMLQSNEAPTGEGWYGFNTGGGNRATDYETIRTATKNVVVSRYFSDGTEVPCTAATGGLATVSWESGHVLTFTLRKDAVLRQGDRCKFATHPDQTNGVAPVGQYIYGDATLGF